jgi:hypothetical protein
MIRLFDPRVNIAKLGRRARRWGGTHQREKRRKSLPSSRLALASRTLSRWWRTSSPLSWGLETGEGAEYYIYWVLEKWDWCSLRWLIIGPIGPDVPFRSRGCCMFINFIAQGGCSRGTWAKYTYLLAHIRSVCSPPPSPRHDNPINFGAPKSVNFVQPYGLIRILQEANN